MTDCGSRLKSQPVQEFLNSANWPQEVNEQLQGYRSGFCQSPEQPTPNPIPRIPIPRIPIPRPQPEPPGRGDL